MVRSRRRAAAVAGVLGVAGVAHAGPDVIVGEITDTWRWGTVGPVTSYSLGTGACNMGDLPATWVANTNQHPVIATNIYRLAGGRFEQIGVSWVKHSFFSENLRALVCGTCGNPTPGEQLNPGCYDAYDSGLNASQTLLGPRSEINAFTGTFNFPFSLGWQQMGNVAYKRIQVLTTDTNPALNPGAKWFGEAQYITTDETGSARFNNVSWREIVPGADAGGGSHVILLTGSTQRSQCAVFAWQINDPGVVIRQVDVAGEGRFYVAYRVHPEAGQYRYEYAVYNMNSDRAAASFSVPFADALQVMTSFKDIAYHSGETISGVDWTAVRGTGSAGVTWATEAITANPNANALRWHTLYNFTIVSDSPPTDVQASIGLWKSGTPASVSVVVAAPSAPPPECAADANGDGFTNGADLSVFLAAFGTSVGDPGFTKLVDFNDDGVISGADLSVLLADFGCPG